MIQYLAFAAVGLFFVGIVIAIVTSEMLAREGTATEQPTKRRTFRPAKTLPDVPASEAAAVAIQRAVSQRSTVARR
jgi:hypothetical protein